MLVQAEFCRGGDSLKFKRKRTEIFCENLFLRRWPRFKEGVPPGEGVGNGDSEGKDGKDKVEVTGNLLGRVAAGLQPVGPHLWQFQFNFIVDIDFHLIRTSHIKFQKLIWL